MRLQEDLIPQAHCVDGRGKRDDAPADRLITPARSSGTWTARWLFWSSAMARVGTSTAAYSFFGLHAFITPVFRPPLSGYVDPKTLVVGDAARGVLGWGG